MDHTPVLEFLQTCYEDYRKRTPIEQNNVLKHNEWVHKCMKSTTPLRILFIDQSMHESSLKRRDLDDQTRSEIQAEYYMNRVYIKERIDRKEVVVPDSLVERTAAECRGNHERFMIALGQWVDPDKRTLFVAQLKWKAPPQELVPWLMKYCSHYFQQIPHKSVETYRSFFSMLECIEHYAELST